jgi:hypothetical protein
MNETEIESLLRKAPRPSAPAALQPQLLADIRLPQSANDVSRTLDLTPMWKRWFPALSFAVLFLGCLIGLAIQTSQMVELRKQNETLAASTVQLEHLRNENAELQRLRAGAQGVAKSQRETEELAKLRAEVEQLRASSSELNRLRAENQRLQAERAAAVANGGVVAPQDDPFAAMKTKAESTACINNLKQIGLAARIWAHGHNTNTLPTDWLTMKNELNTPKILTCPSDTGRIRAASWEEFDGSSASYEFPSIEPSENEPNTVFTRCPIHGNAGLSDGSAHMGPNLNFQSANGKVTLAQPARIGR